LNWELAKQVSAQLPGPRHKDHIHPWPNVMSRRQFTRTVGAAVGLPSLLQAQAKGSSPPVPIPGGTPVLGGGFHVFGPNAIDPINAEPASITDFNGFVGLAYIDGTVTRTNRLNGAVVTLPMIGSDMRFMTGVYKGVDGRTHQGSFAFI